MNICRITINLNSINRDEPQSGIFIKIMVAEAKTICSDMSYQYALKLWKLFGDTGSGAQSRSQPLRL